MDKCDKWLDFIATNILGKLFYRIFISLSVIFLASVMTLGKITEESSAAFQNIWIFAGFMITFLITGFSLVSIIYNSFDKRVPNLKTVVAYCGIGFVGLLVLIVFGLGSGMLQKWDTLSFHTLAIGISLYIFFMDYLLMKSNYFPQIANNWDSIFEFDLGVVAAIVSVVLFGHFIGTIHGKPIEAGFIGGATSFQLLIANVLFNPLYYKIEEQKEKI